MSCLIVLYNFLGAVSISKAIKVQKIFLPIAKKAAHVDPADFEKFGQHPDV